MLQIYPGVEFLNRQKLFRKVTKITTKVLSFDSEKERVSLGFKQLTDNPWENIMEKYPIGSKVKGKVVNLTDYGVFVEFGIRC